jgi:hypothetical protein
MMEYKRVEIGFFGCSSFILNIYKLTVEEFPNSKEEENALCNFSLSWKSYVGDVDCDMYFDEFPNDDEIDYVSPDEKDSLKYHNQPHIKDVLCSDNFLKYQRLLQSSDFKIENVEIYKDTLEGIRKRFDTRNCYFVITNDTFLMAYSHDYTFKELLFD